MNWNTVHASQIFSSSGETQGTIRAEVIHEGSCTIRKYFHSSSSHLLDEFRGEDAIHCNTTFSSPSFDLQPSEELRRSMQLYAELHKFDIASLEKNSLEYLLLGEDTLHITSTFITRAGTYRH